MKIYLSFLLLIFFVGCNSKYDLENRFMTANNIVKKANFVKKDIYTDYFTIRTYQKISNSKLPIKVYIEGDGFSWINKNLVSPNPTPIDPIALKLASIDDYPNIVYIARPCQYVSDNKCNEEFWTNKRFSKEVVYSVNEAIDYIKTENGTKDFKVVGFSGGAAVAVIVSSMRKDISEIVTIAGNLDHKLLHKYHGLPPMNESLNPVDFASKVSSIKQTHYVSYNDEVIPIKIVESFVEHSGNAKNIKVEALNNPTHTQGWIEYFRK